MNFHQIFKMCLSQEKIELIRFFSGIRQQLPRQNFQNFWFLSLWMFQSLNPCMDFHQIYSVFLLRKIALPYPHKCLFGFVEQNVSTDKNFLRNILVTRGDPFVCACPRLRSSRCRQTIVERSSLYFWSIWEQHVLFLIIVHSRMKIYEVLKRASVHLPVFIHYSTGTTTNSASLVLKRVRIRCARRCCCKVFSGRRVHLPLYSPIIRLELPPCR